MVSRCDLPNARHSFQSDEEPKRERQLNWTVTKCLTTPSYSLVSLPRRCPPLHRIRRIESLAEPPHEMPLDEAKRLSKLIRTHVLLATIRDSAAQGFESMRHESPCFAGAVRHPSLADGGAAAETMKGTGARPALLEGSRAFSERLFFTVRHFCPSMMDKKQSPQRKT